MSDFMLRIKKDQNDTQESVADEIPVGKVICLAQNYPKHAKEMNSKPPSLPYFFLKPKTSLIHNGADIILPPLSNEVHHEIELAVIIGKGGKDITEENAYSHIMGYGVFLDLTARDIQREGKKTSRPFGMAKSFDTFAPISDIVPASKITNPMDLGMTLKVNREIRQSDSTSGMLFPVKKLVSFLSSVMTLEKGDIIATGTPPGVSEITEGDSIHAEINGIGSLTHSVAKQ